MATLQRAALLLALLVLTCGCARSDARADLARDMLEAMGGRDALESVQTIVLRGAGTRTRLGQMAVAGGEDPVATRTELTETIDLANGRAAFDYRVTVGDGFNELLLQLSAAWRKVRPWHMLRHTGDATVAGSRPT